MSATTFFPLSRPFTIDEIAAAAEARVVSRESEGGADAPPLIVSVASLAEGRPGDLCFFENPAYADSLALSRATACFLRERHLQALARVQIHVTLAQDYLQQPQPALDVLAEELRLSQQALGEITGEFTSDDLLGVIFSRFCIGK